MHNHFNPKSLLFYGTMIGSVAILFRITTAYGESHLKAPPDVSGRYLSTQPISECPSDSRLVLVIQQSGIYLNGSLLLVDETQETARVASHTAAPEEKHFLTGLLEQQQVNLSGTVPGLADCKFSNQSQGTSSQPTPATVQGTVTTSPDSTFTGKVTLGPSSSAREIEADREILTPASTGH